MGFSPLFDQFDPKEAAKASKWEEDDDDEDQSASHKPFLDESESCPLEDTLKKHEVQYPPGPGSYHMYHRIDGELVAIGFIDITEKYFNSAYFMYKSKYSYLNLGVVGAVIELEYCKQLMDIWHPTLQYYHLGELVLDCPKLNYKLNFTPGQVLCPFSKIWVDFSEARPEMEKLQKMSKSEKLHY